jgi:hypothetical protein
MVRGSYCLCGSLSGSQASGQQIPRSPTLSVRASNIIKMIVNQGFSSGLKPEPVLDYFPYLSPPPAS